MTIINPPYSFIQFGNPNSPIIPVCDDNDIAFHTEVLCTTVAQANTLMDSVDVKLYVVKPEASISSTADITPSVVLFDYSWMPLGKFRISEKRIVLYWPNGLSGISTIEMEQCCKICLSIGTEAVVSNLLKRVDTPFTSVLEYSCEENSYGFKYCADGSIINRVRIPMFLKAPQLSDTETVYFFSNGRSKVLSSVTRKEYECVIDYCTEDLHEKIKIALSHDNVKIESDVFSGGITKNGGYEIDWQDLPGYSKSAMANLKVFASPYMVRNSNCSTCNEYVGCEPVTIEDVTLENATVGVPFIRSIALLGDLPFTFEIVTKPAWMSISLDGDQIILSGTPTEVVESAPIEITVLNCGDSRTETLAATLTVQEVVEECIELNFIGLMTLPDAVVGVAYDFEIEVSGTLPMTISGIVKPAWMTIDVVGNKIVFGGTPDEVGTEIDVQLTAENCHASTINIAQTVDVTEEADPGEPNLVIEFNGITPGTIIVDGFLVGIENAFEISGYSFPLNGSEDVIGWHTGWNTSLAIDTSASGAYSCSLYVNGTFIQCINLTSGGGIDLFGSILVAPTDNVLLVFNNGACV